MAGRVKMFRRVTIRRGVAAAHMSAGQAEPQVHPWRTHLQTLLATNRARGDFRINLIEVSAGVAVHSFPINSFRLESGNDRPEIGASPKITG